MIVLQVPAEDSRSHITCPSRDGAVLHWLAPDAIWFNSEQESQGKPPGSGDLLGECGQRPSESVAKSTRICIRRRKETLPGRPPSTVQVVPPLKRVCDSGDSIPRRAHR
jgi:hypothetical protein